MIACSLLTGLVHLFSFVITRKCVLFQTQPGFLKLISNVKIRLFISNCSALEIPRTASIHIVDEFRLTESRFLIENWWHLNIIEREPFKRF